MSGSNKNGRILCANVFFPFLILNVPRHYNTGLGFSRVSLTSWGEGASLALVYRPSSDGVIIKIPYSLDVYYINQPHILSFLIGLVKTESDIIVRSVKSGVGR